MKYKAFINYRRSDCSELAQLVKLAIEELGYNEDDIFLDLNSIHEGEFPTHIEEALHNTEFFILLISKNSFKHSDEKDYYLEEIKLALELKLRIIPVFYGSVNINNLEIPQEFVDKNFKLKNGISYVPEYSDAFKRKLSEFMKPNGIWNLLKMPTLILTIYALLTICGFVIMYIYDNYFMPEKELVETVVENVQVDEGKLVYFTPKETFSYITSSKEIKCFTNKNNPLITSTINLDQTTQVGFWTVSVGLMYEMSRTRLKPHGNSKSVLAYVAVGVSVVAGFGLGCTLERMAFPKQYSSALLEKLHQQVFWQKIMNRLYFKPNIELIE